jgi:chaperonin GroES
MKFQPLYDRILIRKTDSTGRTKGGLYIPEVANESHQPLARGEVIAVGHGRPTETGTIPLQVAVGDLVYFDRKAATEIPWEGDLDGNVVVCQERHILGTITGAPRDTGLIGDDGKPLVTSGEMH